MRRPYEDKTTAFGRQKLVSRRRGWAATHGHRLSKTGVCQCGEKFTNRQHDAHVNRLAESYLQDDS